WDLNCQWLSYDSTSNGLYPFVLTGQKIDRKFYDNLNSYTGEEGSDGVVRVASANMNYGLLRLVQADGDFKLVKDDRTPKNALGVLPGRSHSGPDKGIMGSVDAEDDGTHPTVRSVLRCLSVASIASYNRVTLELEELTAKTQEDERVERTKEVFIFQRTFRTNRYCMIIIQIGDDRGNTLSDYDVLFTAGPDYDENHLPPGFFVDRQRNTKSPGKLTYYIDYDVMDDWFGRPELENKFGFKIRARPDQGYAYYTVAEHRGTFTSLRKYFEPNRTMMLDVQLRRHVVEGVFRLTQNLTTPEDFRDQPHGQELP